MRVVNPGVQFGSLYSVHKSYAEPLPQDSKLDDFQAFEPLKSALTKQASPFLLKPGVLWMDKAGRIKSASMVVATAAEDVKTLQEEEAADEALWRKTNAGTATSEDMDSYNVHLSKVSKAYQKPLEDQAVTQALLKGRFDPIQGKILSTPMLYLKKMDQAMRKTLRFLGRRDAR